jgi:TrmH family RNA methyltransferase
MKITEIESPDNQRLKSIRALIQLGKKSADNIILLEGHKLIEEALDKKIELIDIFLSHTYYQDTFSKSQLAERLDSIFIVKENAFKGLYTTDTSCGIVATAIPLRYTLTDILAPSKTILLADNIQDPGNLGTIIRTALAFNAAGLILSKGSTDCYSPKVIRSSMGAILALPVIYVDDLVYVIKQIKDNDIRVIALDGAAKQTIWENQPTQQVKAFILGNEGHGISKNVIAAADISVSIPINPQCQSLNVAMAAGIILAIDKFQSGG